MVTKPHTWRLTTWAIVAFNVGVMWYVLNAVQTAGATCVNPTTPDCETAAAIAAAMTIGMAVFFLVAGNLTLGVVSVTTKGRKTRTCPNCWAHTSHRMLICPRCKHDFQTAKTRRSYQTV